MKTPYDVIIRPIITEKSTGYAMASKSNAAKELKYTFEVARTASKTEIKEALEKIFVDIEVKAVNTMSVKGKFKRQGKTSGYTASRKKAIVTLKEGSKEISKFEGMGI